MPNINERIYANKIVVARYNGNYEKQSESEQTGATFTISTSGSRYGGNDTGVSFLQAVITFPVENSTNASTKRISNYAPYVVVKNASLSASGDYPSGSSASMQVAGESTFFEYDLENATYNNTPASIINSYHRTASDAYAGVRMGSTNTFYSNVQYNTTATAVIYGVADSTHKPYTDITWADVVPVVSSQIPTAGGFINDGAESVITWNTNIPLTGNGTKLATTSVLKWRVSGSSTVNTITAQENKAVIPAGTFPANGSIDYCVIVTTSEGFSNAENWITVTTTDATPDAPTNLEPNLETINGNEANVFRWSHNISTGTPQAKADLQYSTNNSTWNSIITATGANEFVEVPADTLTAGNIYWRVRTYNSDNVAGNYSESAQIVVKARPTAPTINSIDNKPLCTVKWGSNDQVGYRVVFEDANGEIEDSGECYGTEKTYTSKTILADGETTVTVYVGNATGEWNSSTATFTVQNVPSESFTVRTIRYAYETMFDFDGVGYITKNGELIGKGNGTYTDKTGAGTCVYNVIKINNGYYTKSADITVNYRIKTAVVYDVEADGEFIVLSVRKDSPVIINKSFSSSVSYNNYCGAEYPTAYNSGYKNESISIAITRNVDNNAVIRSLMGKLCCIKDKQGESTFAVLNSITESVERWNDVTLEFTRVNYESGVAYGA